MHLITGNPFKKGHLFFLWLAMRIKNSAEVQYLADTGIEKGYFASGEINRLFHHDIFPSEDTYDLLSEPLDVSVIMREKADLPEEGWDEPGRNPPDQPDNLMWSYLKDMGRLSCLTLEEERDIAKKIEERERTARNILFDLPQAVHELVKIRSRLEEGTMDAEDVVDTIDTADCTQEDRERLTGKAVALIDTIENLHRMKEEMRAAPVDGLQGKRHENALRAIDREAEEAFLNLRLSRKIFDVIIGRIVERMKSTERSGAVRERLKELIEIDKELKLFKNRLIQANLRLVISVAKRHINKGLSLLDLIQEGNIGLMRAADKYDYQKGCKFSTYATWWIRLGMTRAIADNTRTIRIPVHVYETMNRISRVRMLLVQELGREPNLVEIALKTGLPVEKVRNTIKISHDTARTVSIETPVGDEESTLADFIADSEAPSPFMELAGRCLREEVKKVLSTLTPKEEKIIRMRLGIGENTDHTLEEVGDIFGLTRERIRQIEVKALKKLKHPSRKSLLESFQY